MVFAGHMLAQDRPHLCTAVVPLGRRTATRLRLRRIPDPVKRLLPQRHVKMRLPVGVKAKSTVRHTRRAH